MAQKFEHEWGFMANANGPQGDLLQCQYDSCGKWMFTNHPKHLFELSYDEFRGMHNRGEIDASESLGEITNEWLTKPACHKGINDLIK